MTPAPESDAGGPARGGPTRRERAAVAAFVLAVVAASAVPYAVAWRATPPGRLYVGTTEASQDDYPTYLAKMRAGARGAWTYASPYAPGLEETLTVRPLYAALGAATGAAGAPLFVGYHAGRLAAGALCLLAVYAAARALARSRAERLAAFVLATVGSGVGCLLGREGPRSSWSYDLWVPELNATHGLLTNPHFPAALALGLGALAGAARALETGRRGPALLGGLALALLTLVHTYDDLIVAGALLLYATAALAAGALPPTRLARAAWPFAAAALPAVAWQLAVLARDPSVAQMGRAQPVGSPLDVATGLGLLAPLAVIGAPRLARRGALGGVIVAWAAVVPLLMALPLPFARRMVAGWHVPLGLAAGIGLARLAGAIGPAALRRAALAAVVALASATTLHHLVHQTRRFAGPDPGVLASLPADLVDAYAWLDANAAGGDVVLAPYGPSNWLPVYTDLRPWFGHWAETPDAPARARAVAAFYARGTSDTSRRRLLERSGADWILDGPVGQPPGGVTRLRADRLRNVSVAHRAGRVRILRVESAYSR